MAIEAVQLLVSSKTIHMYFHTLETETNMFWQSFQIYI